MIDQRLAHKALVLNELDRWLLLTDATHDRLPQRNGSIDPPSLPPPRPPRMLQAPSSSE
jgi:hypothetical protein